VYKINTLMVINGASKQVMCTLVVRCIHARHTFERKGLFLRPCYYEVVSVEPDVVKQVGFNGHRRVLEKAR
tara:strand:- start:145 stop:357 length:213 start_codon:yes stop_codon:yes gene_type:complete